jgi:hypothetical protein
MIKWIAALAAVSLAASPVAAQASRTAAAVEEADSMAGGASIAWVMAAIMVIGAIVFIVDDDDPETPTSP